MKHPQLAGKRVLVVEDEFMVAVLVEDLLAEQGCVVVGPFARVSDALTAAVEEQIDLAILDVNIDGVDVFPVAEALDKKGVPFVFVTGYGAAAIPRDRPSWEACSKPFRFDVLAGMLVSKVQRPKRVSLAE